jgi:hypothetical protein
MNHQRNAGSCELVQQIAVLAVSSLPKCPSLRAPYYNPEEGNGTTFKSHTSHGAVLPVICLHRWRHGVDKELMDIIINSSRDE